MCHLWRIRAPDGLRRVLSAGSLTVCGASRRARRACGVQWLGLSSVRGAGYLFYLVFSACSPAALRACHLFPHCREFESFPREALELLVSGVTGIAGLRAGQQEARGADG